MININIFLHINSVVVHRANEVVIQLSISQERLSVMDPHLIELPRRVLIGRDVVYKVPDLCKSLHIPGIPLVLTGEKTLKIAGEIVFEGLKKTLNGSSYPMMQIVKEASVSEAERIRKDVGLIGYVVSVGGGKVIDVGKLIAFENKIPFVSAPTSPSHDGIASDRVSLRDGDTKHSIRAKPPNVIAADIRILMKAPYRMIASGCADIIANHTSVFDWKLGRDKKGEYFSEYAADLALLSAKIVLKSAKLIREGNERGMRDLVEALISSGISMSLVDSSRPASGSEHLFSHALEISLSNTENAEKLPMHGESCGFGSILMAYLQGQDWIGLKNALKTIGAPTTIKELGVSEEKIIEALLNANNIRKRYTILDEKKLDRERAFELCKAAGVME